MTLKCAMRNSYFSDKHPCTPRDRSDTSGHNEKMDSDLNDLAAGLRSGLTFDNWETNIAIEYHNFQ